MPVMLSPIRIPTRVRSIGTANKLRLNSPAQVRKTLAHKAQKEKGRSFCKIRLKKVKRKKRKTIINKTAVNIVSHPYYPKDKQGEQNHDDAANQFQTLAFC